MAQINFINAAILTVRDKAFSEFAKQLHLMYRGGS